MRRTTTALTTLLLLAGAAVGCSSEKSYEEITAGCVAALKDRPSGDKAKPAACDGVKDDDYTALVMGQVLEGEGWVDENGDPDLGEILDTPTP